MWLELTKYECGSPVLVNMNNVIDIEDSVLYRELFYVRYRSFLNIKETQEQILKMIREYE